MQFWSILGDFASFNLIRKNYSLTTVMITLSSTRCLEGISDS